MKVPNLGEFKVLTLRETPLELAHHTIDTPDQAADYWRTHIPKDPRHNPEVECFYVLCLSVRKKPLGYSIVSTGTLDTILVHPREVFRPAIIAAAACIVLFHNHPSGDPTPSEADIKVTRDLVRGGQLSIRVASAWVRSSVLSWVLEKLPAMRRRSGAGCAGARAAAGS
jgi:DNA repair protein RadC